MGLPAKPLTVVIIGSSVPVKVMTSPGRARANLIDSVGAAVGGEYCVVGAAVEG